MENRVDIECIHSCQNYLGESPLWRPTTQSLYWINCQPDAQLFQLNVESRQVRQWSMPKRIGAIILGTDGALIVGLADGLYTFNPDTHDLCLLAAAPHEDKVYLHEGKCDRQGRLWIGSLGRKMMSHRELGGGYFYRLESNRLIPIIDGISVANGLAWSPDGKTMYCTDTPTGVVWAYDYDCDSAAVTNRRVFAAVNPTEGSLDGAAVDCDGGYWTALFRGGCLRRYTPSGKLDREVRLPFSQPTMLAFGGKNMDQIFVTTATHGKTTNELQSEPELGGVFRINGVAQGLPEPTYCRPPQWTNPFESQINR